MYILAVLGLILVSACVIFTAVFRKKRLILSIDIRNMHFMSHVAIFRLVRLMSPTLTAITCVGCFLLYFCIFFAAIQSKTILPTSIICNVMFSFSHSHTASASNTLVFVSYLFLGTHLAVGHWLFSCFWSNTWKNVSCLLYFQ